jgi:uncharacterized membrane protein
MALTVIKIGLYFEKIYITYFVSIIGHTVLFSYVYETIIYESMRNEARIRIGLAQDKLWYYFVKL